MSDWEKIASHFNATAKCRRLKDGKPKVQHDPGVTYICCEHPKCACSMNFHGDEPLSVTLAKWRALHG